MRAAHVLVVVRVVAAAATVAAVTAVGWPAGAWAAPLPGSRAWMTRNPNPPRPVAEESAPGVPQDPEVVALGRMQRALTTLLQTRPLRSLRVGMRVVDARSGRLFFGHRGDALMDPASLQKVLTAATAFMRLGGDFQFRTHLAGPAPDPQGLVPGDLYLRGDGDPILTGSDLDRVARALARRGVTRIDGALVVDPRRLGGSGNVGGRNVGGDWITVNRSRITVEVRPAGTPKAAAHVTLRPASRFFTVRNRVTTRARGKSRIKVSLHHSDGGMIVDVSGRASQRSRRVVVRKRLGDTALHAGWMLSDALHSAGITVRDGVRTGPMPADAPPLFTHHSPPLWDIMRAVNKRSVNDYAERVLETVGAELYGADDARRKGVRALREVMAELGLPPDGFIPVNGSGLHHVNRISAETMALLLHRLYHDPRIGPEVAQSLSVGGVDGTTRGRFRQSMAAKRVRSKTGTLRKKSCLAGYVGDGSHVLAFAFLVEGFRPKRIQEVRDAQVQAVGELMRYVYDVDPTPSPLLNALVEVPPSSEILPEVQSGKPTDDVPEPADTDGEKTPGAGPPDQETIDEVLSPDGTEEAEPADSDLEDAAPDEASPET